MSVNSHIAVAEATARVELAEKKLRNFQASQAEAARQQEGNATMRESLRNLQASQVETNRSLAEATAVQGETWGSTYCYSSASSYCAPTNITPQDPV
jgi:hypothetical protein